jgi:hypothetical protein
LNYDIEQHARVSTITLKQEKDQHEEERSVIEFLRVEKEETFIGIQDEHGVGNNKDETGDDVRTIYFCTAN